MIFLGCLLFDNTDVLGQSDRKLVDSYSAVITEDNGFQWIYTAKKYKKKRKKFTCFYSVSLMNHMELKNSKGDIYYWHDGYGKNCELRKTPPIKVVDLGWAIYVECIAPVWRSEDACLFTPNGEYLDHAWWSLSELTQKKNPQILGSGSNLIVVSDDRVIINEHNKSFETFRYYYGFFYGKERDQSYYTIYAYDGHLLVEKADNLKFLIFNRSLLMCSIMRKAAGYNYVYESIGNAVFDNLGRKIITNCEEVTEINGRRGESLLKVRIGKYSSDTYYGIYDLSGNIIIPCEYKEITVIQDNGGNNLFMVKKGEYSSDTYYGIYSSSGKVLIPCEYSSISSIEACNGAKYYRVETKYSKRNGVVDILEDFVDFVIPCEYKSITMIDGLQGEKLFKVRKGTYSDECGIFDCGGNEILAPEFQDCNSLDGNYFSFKMNGYWGVMNRQGNTIIPINRHYTSIDYSRTLKMFTFTKETETAYFKGECNASGAQTSIEKTGTKSKPKPQAKQETKPTSQTTSTNSTSNSSSSSNTTSSPEKPGLLYKGEYTICRSRQYDEMTGNPMGISASDETQVVEIYEDHVYLGVHYCEYQSTNNRGERVYKDNLNNDATLYVSPNFDIRYYWSMTSMYGSCNVVIPVEKGTSYMSGGNGGYNAPQQGGYNGGNSGGNNGGNSGTNTNTSPKTHKCGLCNGTGRVIENNGTSFGKTKYCNECGKTVPDYHYHTTCPSCNGKGYW